MAVSATLGYARVSTAGQDLDAQLAALTAVGVDAARIFSDKLSGSAKTARPGPAAMLDYARPEDTLVVAWQEQTQEVLVERQRWIDQHLSRGQDRGVDHGIEL